MSYRSERFNRQMKSLEVLCEQRDISKWAMLSDHGAGARAIRERSVQLPQLHEKHQLLAAEARLRRAGKKRLIPVLRLIVKNRNDSARSIARLAMRSTSWNAAHKKYFAHRKALLDFFQAR